MNPVDVVKQRMQLCESPYRSALECLRCVVSKEGLAGLWRSYPLTAATNVPFTCVHFTTYETSKAAIDSAGVFGGAESPAVQSIAGGVAGGLAAAVTTPLDVVKTRMQTHGERANRLEHDARHTSGRKVVLPTQAAAKSSVSHGHVRVPSAGMATVPSGTPQGAAVLSAMEAMRMVLLEDGARGLLRGIVPRVLFHVPAAAISWTTYESVKSVLLKIRSDE